MSGVLDHRVTVHAADCAQRQRHRRLVVLGLLAGGTALVGTGAVAAWQATSTVTSGDLQAASAAPVELVDANGGSLGTAVGDLVPGDWFHRYVDVRNDGDQQDAFTGAVTASGDLGDHLSVVAETCPVSWTTTGGSSTCGQGTPTRLGSGPLSSPVALTHGSIAPGAGAAQHVRYTFAFSEDAPAELQGRSGAVSISVMSTLVGGRDRTDG